MAEQYAKEHIEDFVEKIKSAFIIKVISLLITFFLWIKLDKIG